MFHCCRRWRGISCNRPVSSPSANRPEGVGNRGPFTEGETPDAPLPLLDGLNWCKSITFAFHRRNGATSINSALTGVNSGLVISGPEILRISVSIVPPGVFNVIKFKRGVITVVLNENLNHLKIHFSLNSY